MRSQGAPSSIHCLTPSAPPSLDEWAPTNVVHAVKALEACGIRFTGPVVMHQCDTATAIQSNLPSIHRRFVVSRRHQTTYRPHGCDPTVENWKVKQPMTLAWAASSPPVFFFVCVCGLPNHPGCVRFSSVLG